ncbi:MAG: nucleoside-diphosphate-sugar epimerase [Acidimicrobiales bacterium]|nr:nucleoside-diphosphate-sugar epimerase [Acidimicrobiales bacterium]
MHEAASPNVVVTGAAGWLGQNLVRELVAEGRETVRCLVREPAEGALLEVLSPAVEPVVGDVRDPAAIAALFDGLGGATTFHTAGIIHPPGTTRPFFDVNVGGTRLVLDGARRAGVARFVHVSSNSPFGANARPSDRFTEDSPFNPYLSYGQSKLEGEELVRRAHQRGDLQTVILRPPWFYGPHQPARQDQFFSALRKGRFPLIGDGTQQRSMVFTGNLVQGCLRAEVADAAPGNAYWIADAEPYELRRVFEGVREALALEGLAVSGRIRPVPRLLADIAVRADTLLQAAGRYVQPLHVLGELRDTIACDISAARKDLGYEPRTALVEGMRASIRSCLARGARL